MSASSSFPATTSAPRTLARDLPQHIGERVLLQGWLHHQRHLKAVDFLLLRDRSGITQIVVEDSDLRGAVAPLPHETVLEVRGHAAASAQAPNGVELHDPAITVLSDGTEEPPLELYRPEMQALLTTRLDHAAISLRHPARAMTQRLLAAAVHSFQETLIQHGFTGISTPKLL